MSDKLPEISLRAAAKGLVVRCQACGGTVRGDSDTPDCACEQPRPNEATVALDAMLAASRRGRTVRRMDG